MAQNWLNKDGLFLKFGTDKTTSEAAGEFALPGYPDRMVEFAIDLTTLSTSSASIVSDNLIFPAPPTGQMIITRVELLVETAATSGGSATFKCGLIQMDRSTVPTNYDHAFIASEVVAQMAAAGDTLYYVGADSLPAGSTKGGTLIGSQPANATGPYYITAQAGTAVFTAGKVRIRVFYRGIGTITQ
jgi:hypothetical protein